MKITFTKLTTPISEMADLLNKWENDPALVPFIRPNSSQEDMEKQSPVTVEEMEKRLEHHEVYLIYADGQMVGEMNYQIDPAHLYKKVSGTAWIGINIGEESARGKGVGTQAMQYLEEQINAHGLQRIELGVFEFNTNAIKLYKKMGYQEIGRINNFTFWQNKMWQDIRMEKYLE